MGVVLLTTPALAGGGPETTLVVVNGDSPLSLQVANLYVKLREIPETHVVWIHDMPSLETVDIETFRSRIWGPIREHLAEYGLEEEIDTIAYSADFPYRVNFKSDLRKHKIPSRSQIGSIASLTGMTYFVRRVEAGNPGYLGANRYYRRDLSLYIPAPRPATEAEEEAHRRAKKALKDEEYLTALRILEPLLRSYPWRLEAWIDLARACAALGRDDAAIEALSRAVQGGWAHSLVVRSDKQLKRLSSDPRYEPLIERMQGMKGPFQPAHGFRSHYAWAGRENPVPLTEETALDRYYLSTLLAHTGIRGNSLPEVSAYLRASTSSDGRFPDGTVYLMENSNVRAVARERYFHATAAALEERGRAVEILRGSVPQKKDDVIGAVVGSRKYEWEGSGSRLLPGAIAEAMTSYGGWFGSGSQTKLTEFLANGAAGSSGAVAEPYALQEKFPVSQLHVHYADGCSLAEAFFQSVLAPYQLIVVGDPLTRPFAHLARVVLADPGPGRPWRGRVTLEPRVEPAPGRSIGSVELWVDGQLVQERALGEPFVWDTTAVEDGDHELRLVAVEDSPIETRSSATIRVDVANGQGRVEVEEREIGAVLGEAIVVTGTAPGAEKIEIFQGVRALASTEVREGRWEARLPASLVGLGDVALFARAFRSDGTTCRSGPVRVSVAPPAQLKASKEVGPQTEPGLKARVQLHTGEERDLPYEGAWKFSKALQKERKEVERLYFEGQFEVPRSGFYQLSVDPHEDLRGVIDGEVTFNSEEGGIVYVAMGLEAGWHDLVLEVGGKNPLAFGTVLSGEEPARGGFLEDRKLRHRR